MESRALALCSPVPKALAPGTGLTLNLGTRPELSPRDLSHPGHFFFSTYQRDTWLQPFFGVGFLGAERFCKQNVHSLGV